MSNFDRIFNIYSAFSHEMRNDFCEKNVSGRDLIKMLRVRYWYEGLRQRTKLISAYALERHFEAESFQKNSNGTIRHYRSKWSGYHKNINTPKSKTLKRVELLAPGSTRELEHPLWEIMLHTDQKHIDTDLYMRKLSVDVQTVIFSSGFSGLSAYSNREAITQRLLDKLERRASLDCLACLICLVLEVTEQKRNLTAVKVAHTLHNVLLMVGIELQARKVALPLLDWVIEHILSLGVMPHLRVWMTGSDYVHASAYLNLMVYQNEKRRGKCLEWSQRVKVMQRLIHGHMGMDVEYAMTPQFELRSDLDDIPAELVKDFNRASALRIWGWDCILEGRSEHFPPVELFL